MDRRRILYTAFGLLAMYLYATFGLLSIVPVYNVWLTCDCVCIQRLAYLRVCLYTTFGLLAIVSVVYNVWLTCDCVCIQRLACLRFNTVGSLFMVVLKCFICIYLCDVCLFSHLHVGPCVHALLYQNVHGKTDTKKDK